MYTSKVTEMQDWLDEIDYLKGEGCPEPEYALIASLLIAPEYLGEATPILKTGRGFKSKMCGALYEAMLHTPYTGGPAFPDWVLPVCEAAGKHFGDIMWVVVEVSIDCSNVALYAQMVFANLLQARILDIATHLAQGASRDPVGRIDKALTDLRVLQKRLAEVRDVF
jgi:hypothetical protein